MAGLIFIAVTIPLARFTDYLLARTGAAARDRRGRGVSGPLLQDDVYKAYDQHLVLRNQPGGGAARSDQPDWRVGQREIDPAALRQPAGGDQRRLDPADGGPISASLPNANRVRQRIGMVFQSYNLFPHMSVLDNITLAPQEGAGREASEAEGQARALLERFGLADKAGRVSRIASRAGSSSGSRSSAPWR